MSVWVQRAIGERLAELRGREPRRDLAGRLGMNRLMYGRIEKGGQNLTLATLLSLASAHRLALADLLDGVEVRAAQLESEARMAVDATGGEA